MYRGSLYDKSQSSMERFADAFNSIDLYPNITWQCIKEETYDNDGYFLNIAKGNTIGFDWKIRDRYFNNGHFQFDTLGQFERKLKKPTIQLSIQVDKQETAILVAWHKDFLEEEKQSAELATDASLSGTGHKQSGEVRYTSHFKIYTLEEFRAFKAMINRAFQEGIRDHTVWE